ncbi:HlyD family secretion protein [Solimonas marina]|uniref:HlyD family secretion protein n=1 Tax=Solimonas marina TaxID=2714601 RepID=UPI0019D30C5B
MPPPQKRLNAPATIAIAVIGITGVLLILYAWRLWPFSSAVERTDNAYVHGRVTLVSPRVDGYVTAVPVQDFMPVRAGQLLAQIDDHIYRQHVDQAQASLDSARASLANFEQAKRSRQAAIDSQHAQLASAEAQLKRATADMRRADALIADGSISTREHDQTAAAFEQAKASVQQARAALEVGRQDLKTTEVGRSSLSAAVESAEAQLKLAQINLQNTRIVAPESGRLSEVSVRVGQYVSPGSQLMYLVPPHPWVIANFKEAQTAHMHPGQQARILVDALGGATIWGTVERLSPATGSQFSVLKPDNATGNFVKIAQRIPVRIKIDDGQQLAARLSPGMSVVVHVDTATEADDAGHRTAP